jgi:hypothetical protein
LVMRQSGLPGLSHSVVGGWWPRVARLLLGVLVAVGVLVELVLQAAAVRPAPVAAAVRPRKRRRGSPGWWSPWFGVGCVGGWSAMVGARSFVTRRVRLCSPYGSARR